MSYGPQYVAVQSIIAGDYGYSLVIPAMTQASLNLLNATSLELLIETPASILPVPIVLPMTAGLTALVISGTTYPAGQWAFRNLVSGDIPSTLWGRFQARLVYQDASARISSNPFALTIVAP